MAALPVTPDIIQPIIQLGALGGVTVWLMFQVMPQLQRNERALDRFSRTLLLWLVESASPGVKRQAEELLDEVKDADRTRTKL